MKNEKNNFYKSSVVLLVVSVGCQLINLLRDILLARKLGTNAINDIYLTSQTVISLMITLVNSPMATAYVPVASKYFVKEDEEKKNQFLGKIY